MAIEILMPKLSSTMEVGTLLQWFKEEGESVEIGEPLFEIMTDKINIEVESYEEGVLLKKYYSVDDEVPVNQIVGFIGQENEAVPDESPGIHSNDLNQTLSTTKNNVGIKTTEKNQIEVISNEKVRATPAARRVAKEKQIELALISGSGPNGRIHEKDVKNDVQSNQTTITPLAKKMAELEHIDVTSISGTGANGKIVKEDVTALLQDQSNAEEEITVKRKKLSGMRKVIADRMQESITTAPHVTLTSDIDMTKVKELRSQLLPSIEKQTGFRLSFTEVIVKAVGLVLARNPAVNASLIQNEIVYNEHVNIGLAVAVEDGLMVPVLKNVNTKGLSSLTTEAKEIGKLARENKLKPDQLKGSTFTISNLGMFAIDAFTPIINLPETAILGVGRILEKPVVINQEIVIRPMMTVSLSFDHRAIDGAPAAAFLTELKYVLEHPFELLV